MHEDELSRPGTVLAPGMFQGTIRRESMHAAIAVTVRYKHVAIGRKSGAGRHVEWLAVKCRGRRVRSTQGHQQRAIGFVLGDRVQSGIGDPDLSLPVDRKTMDEAGELALAPR